MAGSIMGGAAIPASGPVKYSTVMTRGSITVGKSDQVYGYSTTFGIGSLASTTFFKGYSCTEFYTQLSSGEFKLVLTGTYPQSEVDHVVCSIGTFVGMSATTFTQSGGLTYWFWSGASMFATSGTETIEIWG